MDRNTILAFILIGLILILYPVYMKWLGGDKKQVIPAPTDTTAVTLPMPEPAKVVEKVATAQPKTEGKAHLGNFPTAPEEEVKVETPLYSAIFSTRGGNLKSFVLKKYVDFQKGKIDLVNSQENTGDLDLIFVDSSFSLSGASLTTSAKRISLNQKDQPQTLTFSLSASGLELEKSFTFYPERYSFDLEVSVRAKPGSLGRRYYLAWDSGLPPTEKDRHEDLSYFATYAKLGGEILENKGPKGEEAEEYSKSGKTSWVSSRSKYFVASLISPDSAASGFYARGEREFGLVEQKSIELTKKLAVRLEKEIPPQAEFSHRFQVYLGPLDFWALKKYHMGLENMVNLGWKLFKPVAIGILWLFIHLKKILLNYGIVVIVFTILMKIAFFPVSRKMTRYSLAMAELAPKMNKLKEKYKDDKQRLNQEIFKLYKEHKVNPLGGCLPMLMQMPIFWAFFVLMRSTIEMRQAPFVGWLSDLSLKDPYYILPVLMAVSMFFQQKMTMKDPRQKMMVYLMPGLFFFLFMNFPAGLTLYWTVYNLLSLVEYQIYRPAAITSPSPA